MTFSPHMHGLTQGQQALQWPAEKGVLLMLATLNLNPKTQGRGLLMLVRACAR